MPSAIILATYALAVARVVRLINADKITERPRRWVVVRLWARTIPDELPEGTSRRWPGIYEAQGRAAWARAVAAERLDNNGEPPLLAYLVTCPWCVSIYVGAVAAPLIYWLGESPWLLVPALALALSYLTGFLAELGE